MVRNYIKKGGHGGHRAGAGLSKGHWDYQGGRAAAATAKTISKATAVAEKKTTFDGASAHWTAMVAASKKAQNAQPAADQHRSPRKAEPEAASSSCDALSPVPSHTATAADAVAVSSSEQQ